MTNHQGHSQGPDLNSVATESRVDPQIQQQSVPTPIICRDGYQLSGYFFSAELDHNNLASSTNERNKGAVIIAPATGFKAQFYFSFARWLSFQGYAVLTFANRGIGDSKNDIPMSAQTATLVDWGQLDLRAAVQQLRVLCPEKSITLIGHSAGAQLIGLLDNYAEIDRYVLFAASSGFFGHLDLKTRLLAYAVFYGWMPLSNQFFGYSRTEMIGFGQDLPTGVAKQWRKWCSSPGYMANSFDHDITEHFYADIAAPILCLTATDDHIATPKNVDDFLRFLPNADITKRFVTPKSLNLNSIGHSDLLRRRCQAYWPEILQWLQDH